MPQYRTAPPAGYPYGNRPQVAAPVIPQSRPQYSAPGYGTPGYGSQNRAPYAAPQATPRYGNPQGYNSPQNNRQYSQGRASEAPGQQHLGDWMQRRQALSPQEKERALQNEPGFNRLAPQQQQRLVQRLRDLDAMRPTERERTLARVENMERLSPQQKEQVRGAATQFQQMSPDRERVVRRAFQDLRNVPPGLRGSELYGPRYSGQFSPQERSVLGNLLSVEPYQPAPLPPR